MKFRTKTIIGVALIEGILLSLLGASLISKLELSNQQTIERRIETTGRLIAASLRDAMIASDLATIESVSREILETGDLVYLRVLDSQQRPLIEQGRLPQGAPVPDEELWAVDDGVFDRDFPVEMYGQAFGRLQFGIDVSPLHALIRATRQWTLGISLLEMALVALFSFALGTYLTRQLLRLRNASRAVASGDLHQSLPVVGNDEISETAEAFNDMLEKLHLAEVERKRFMSALREAASVAESANQAKSRFLATMSHELRTPMNGILGMSQILQAGGLSPGEKAECVNTIFSCGQSLMGLLNDILDLSKIEAGQLELHPEPVGVDGLIAEVIQLHRANAESKGLQLGADLAALRGRAFVVDGLRLRQIIGNLIGNAIKFTDRGSVRLETLLGEGESGQCRLRVNVIDSGIGIPADRLDRVFKPFSQVDDSPTRRFGGTGLGLSIVRTLAERMGGEVGVESTSGVGSVFWLDIPLQEAASLVNPRSTAGTPGVLFAGRVLVADDDAINRQVISRLLENLGVQVSLVGDGSAVVEAWAAADGFDLVLMDINMPEMDGFLATESLLAYCAAHGVPAAKVVALTANAYPEDQARALASGMIDFLSKPVQLSALKTVLARFLPMLDRPVAEAMVSTAQEAELSGEARQALAEILPLIEEQRFEGIQRFESLFETLDAANQAHLRPLADKLAVLEFADAFIILKKII